MSENQDRGDNLNADDQSGDTDDLDKSQELTLEEKLEKNLEEQDDKGEKKGESKEEKDPKGKLMVPKAVFDSRLSKAKEREAAAVKRAEEAEAKIQAQTGNVDADKIEAELDQAEEDLEKAIADGNADKKVALRKLIRSKNQQLAESRAAVLAARGTAVAVEQVLYNALIDRIEIEHPELNRESEKYDVDIEADIVELKTDFEVAGHSSSQALSKAVKLYYKNVKVEESEDDPKETTEEKAARLASERKEAATKKGLEAKGKQPADNKKSGLDSDKGGAKLTAADVSKMSSKEFNALTPEQKSKYRGDEV